MQISAELQLLADQNSILNTTTKRVISIEPRLTQILKLLLSNRGKVVKREDIIDAIWGNYNSGQDLLTHSISMLRKSIGKDLIITIPKKGYMIYQPILSSQPSQINFLRKYTWILVLTGIVILRLMIPWHH